MMTNPVHSTQGTGNSSAASPRPQTVTCELLPVNCSKGFTLVETLVAIAILMIALLGPFYSLQQSITYSNASRDKLAADSLAQEGMEFVYAIRDDNYLTNIQAPGTRQWLSSLDGTAGGTSSSANCYISVNPNGCMLDPTQNTVQSCSADGCTPLNLEGGLYTYDTSGDYVPTRFIRSVTLTQVSATQTNVTVQVSWSTNRVPYTTTVTESLYNWL